MPMDMALHVYIDSLPLQKKLDVLTALGTQREVEGMCIGQLDVQQLATAVASLPAITTLQLAVTLPDGLTNAAEQVQGALAILQQLRGLQSAIVGMEMTTLGDPGFGLEELFPVGNRRFGAFAMEIVNDSRWVGFGQVCLSITRVSQ
ncbi:unnamed protein product [Vitrella brassicaformis CCMP3155]|uniref:Uncharacterized protein n=2 Tax=Vitrella brassicaformis TaxID=1169539 RepID=A0A0G4FWK3_VITBC|nr:unnamed protein product [Vitrella brassicaformis CCMP3155]|eukprot:CEM19604.1 unnamed protein product [Vitrella brassicaformis CCMP3155]